MKQFSDIQNHSSYRALPAQVREVVRIALQDENHDLISALIAVNPRAAGFSRDVQLDALRKVLTMSPMQTLLIWAVFDLDLSEVEDVPPIPNGPGLL